ncbi:MAG: aldehyde dehydrogenase family protein, partial [Burkholderiaceae bacterium]
MQSINPHTGDILRTYEPASDDAIEALLLGADDAFRRWRTVPFSERADRMRAAARTLREREDEFAGLMADEMGKILKDGVAEIRKCADCCDYFAENAERFLADQLVASDAANSYVAFDPLGPILAVMPWNFPFWQVFRFAAPSLMAGNVGVLKHASNVSGCALAIQDVFRRAGFPEHVFSTALVESKRIEG